MVNCQNEEAAALKRTLKRKRADQERQLETEQRQKQRLDELRTQQAQVGPCTAEPAILIALLKVKVTDPSGNIASGAAVRFQSRTWGPRLNPFPYTPTSCSLKSIVTRSHALRRWARGRLFLPVPR